MKNRRFRVDLAVFLAVLAVCALLGPAWGLVRMGLVSTGVVCGECGELFPGCPGRGCHFHLG